MPSVIMTPPTDCKEGAQGGIVHAISDHDAARLTVRKGLKAALFMPSVIMTP